MAADHKASVEKLREKIGRLRDQQEWVKTSPLPKADMKAFVAEMYRAQLTAAGHLDLEFKGLADPDVSERAQAWQRMLTASTAVHATRGDPTIPVPLANLITWLAGDDMLRWLNAKIDALELVPGPPAAERRQMLADLVKDLAKVESEEEALICKAEAAGTFIGRREDADPAIVLEYDPQGDMIEPGLPRVTLPGCGAVNAEPAAPPAAAASPRIAAAPAGMPAPAHAAGPRPGAAAFMRTLADR